MSAGAAIDELRRDANAVACTLDAALQQIADTELLTDLPQVDRPALVVAAARRQFAFA
jgi:hypothetical protein